MGHDLVVARCLCCDRAMTRYLSFWVVPLMAAVLLGRPAMAESPFRAPPTVPLQNPAEIRVHPGRQADEVLAPKPLIQQPQGSVIVRGRSIMFRPGLFGLRFGDDGQPLAIAHNLQEFTLMIEPDGGVMMKPPGDDAPPPILPARDVIPGARAGKGSRDIREAWLIQPTTRYINGVLGDTVEASALRVTLPNGAMVVQRAEGGAVYEDLQPRIADIDGDGREDVLVIRSTATQGASVVAYGLTTTPQGRAALRELGATPPLGRPKAWLNPIGVGDFDGDGRPELAMVENPYTEGVLSFWRLQNGRFVNVGRATGFSNHKMGSTQTGLAVIRDLDGDGVPDLIVPSLDRKSLRLISFKGGVVREIAQLPLKSPVKADLLWVKDGVMVGLEDNTILHMVMMYR